MPLLNRCWWRATSNGLGDFVVASALTGYYAPADCVNPAVFDGLIYSYVATSDDETQHEEGFGVWDTGTDTIVRNVTSSSNANAKVNFSAAPKVMMTDLSRDFRQTLSENRDYFVDAATGDDDNDGLTALTAFATINRAIDLIVNGIAIEPSCQTLQVFVAGDGNIYDEYLSCGETVGTTGDGFGVSIVGTGTSMPIIQPTGSPPTGTMGVLTVVGQTIWSFANVDFDPVTGGGGAFAVGCKGGCVLNLGRTRNYFSAGFRCTADYTYVIDIEDGSLCNIQAPTIYGGPHYVIFASYARCAILFTGFVTFEDSPSIDYLIDCENSSEVGITGISGAYTIAGNVCYIIGSSVVTDYASGLDESLVYCDATSVFNGAQGIRTKAGAVVVGDLPPGTSQIIHNTSADTHALYANDGGVLRVIGLEVVTSDRLYHVDGSTGDDANDGLTTGTAFATIQRAVDEVCTRIVIRYPAVVGISVAPGTYDEWLVLYQYMGYPAYENTYMVYIVSSTLDAADVIIKPTTAPINTLGAVVTAQSGVWNLDSITMDATGTPAFYCVLGEDQAFLYMTACRVRTDGAYAFLCYFNSYIYAAVTVFGEGSFVLLSAAFRGILHAFIDLELTGNATIKALENYYDTACIASLNSLTLNGFTLTKAASELDLNSTFTQESGTFIADLVDLSTITTTKNSNFNGMTTVRQKSGAVVVGDIAPNTSQIIHNTSADTHALYANDSGVLRVIGQEVVTSDRTYHVDGSTGDDGNDGLTTGTAFATIQRAVNEVCIAIIIQYHANIRISVAPGIYDEFVVLYPYIGFPSDLQTTPIFSFIVTIHSSTLNAADVVIKPTTTPPSTVLSGVVSVQGGAWQIFGITADETEASGPYGCWKSLAQSFLYTVNCTSVVQSGGAGIVSYFNSFSYHESHQFILNGGSPYILDAEYKAILTVSGSTIELADDTTPLIYSYSDAFAGMSLDGITLNGFTLTKGDSYCDLNSAITDFGGGVPLNDIIDIPNSFIGTNSRIMDMFATKVKSGAVIADDLVPGSWSVIDDGTDVRLYANKSGTLVKSAALT